MKRSNVLAWLGVAALAAGCSSPLGPTPELDEARAQYEAAANNPNVDLEHSVQMYEARKELDQAADAVSRDAPQAEIQHYTHMAKTRVRIAEVNAETAKMREEAKQLENRSSELRLDARTSEANRATARAQRATSTAVAAERRARAAEQQLSELEAEQTERGLVLTLGGVLFEFNKANLKEDGLRRATRLSGFLIANPQRSVLIEGHTDNVGSDEVNLKLSLARAEAVSEALVENGVSSGRLLAEGLGKARPVGSNSTDEGRQLNRRVEIIILEPGEALPARLH